MIKVNKKNRALNKTTEFLAIFATCFGLMIGSGLYLKNSAESGGVLGNAHGNPILAICMWIAIGMTATMMMLVYIEAFSGLKKDEHSALLSLGHKFIGRKFGSLLSVYYLIIYTPILTSIGALYVTSVFFDGLDSYLQYHWAQVNNVDVLGYSNWNGMTNVPNVVIMQGHGLPISSQTRAWIEICVGLTLLISFTILNSLTKKPAKIMQTVIVGLKSIPILVAIFGGIALAVQGVEQNVFERWNENAGNTAVTEWLNGKQVQSNFNLSFVCILSTATPIMFSFNGFADGAALQRDIEHKKVIAPALLSAMIATTFFYVIISITIFLAGSDGNIFNVYQRLFRKVPELAFVVRIVAAITVLSLLNAYTAVQGPQLKAAIEEKLIYWKGNKELSHTRSSWYAFILVGGLTIIYMAISMIITWQKPAPNSIWTQYDYFFVTNTLSDLIAIAAFSFYLTIMIAVLVNRRTKRVEVVKRRGVLTMGIIACCIIGFVLAFQYVNLYVLSFIDSINPGDKTKSITLACIFTFLGIALVVLYFINEYLMKKAGMHQGKNDDKTIKITAKQTKKEVNAKRQ